MKINQGLWSKIGWIVAGYNVLFIAYNFFERFEIREDVLSTVNPDEIEVYRQLFVRVIESYTVDWLLISCTGILIYRALHTWLHISKGVCAGITTIICRLIYFCSLQVFKTYESVHVVTTIYPPSIITLLCCIISITPLIGVFLYKKMTV